MTQPLLAHALPALGRLLAPDGAAGLGLPVACAGCGAWDVPVCAACLALLGAAPSPVEHADAAGDLEVLAAAAYAGPVRRLVLAWKNGAREDLEAPMTKAARGLGRAWAERADEQASRAVADAGALLVVPAPSGWRRRARGRLVAARAGDAVALGAAAAWRESGRVGGAVVASADLLRRAGRSGEHQAGRSARARRANRARPPEVLADVAGMPVLLVDDVVTTGATLGACARALADRGAVVLGAVALAASPGRSSPPTTVPGRPC